MKKLGQYLLICGLLILNIPGCSPYGTQTIDLQTEQNFSDAQRIILENQEMPWEQIKEISKEWLRPIAEHKEQFYYLTDGGIYRYDKNKKYIETLLQE